MNEYERRRHSLFQRLEEVLGPEHAAALMEHIPPFAWDRLATKDDLERFATKDDLQREIAHLGDVLGERIEGQGYRLEALMRERIDAQTKLLVFSLLGAVFTTGSLAFGAALL